ncbi:GTPase-activating Rap/Ran-GAP domain-like protein 3 isoform X2 [Dysidea avara]|uniref:GTPase-activating Rap/Ran-GAP domain-like protein 3 isoform X2 n=1 Tax=Dysidea avara TaxID=196820 RepID=UPI003322C066
MNQVRYLQADHVSASALITTPPRVRKRFRFGSSCSDDLHVERTSKSCSNLTSVHGRLGGSVEMLDNIFKCANDGYLKVYRKELGVERRNGESHDPHPHALLENPESETRWYFKYFLAKSHSNYVGYDVDKSPYVLSVVPSDQICRCILWRKVGSKKLSVTNTNGKMPSLKLILEKYTLPKSPLKEITNPEIQKDILTLEEQEGAVNFKFGILYAKAGQRTDDEMFSNEFSSPEFDQFLDLLGEKVDLLGWEQFKGGLDTKNNSTGKQSLYTVFQGHEIMFHVSTMLPYHAENKQQVERKRHLGNDIAVIIYIESNDDEYPMGAALSFDPSNIKSKFNHIFAVVTYSRSRNSYKLIVYSAESVPEFNPPLVANFDFTDPRSFKDFLLTKLINGEKAANSAPVFADKRERTLDLLLKHIEENYNNTKSLSSSQPVNRRSSKENAFIDFGQRLKVQCIQRGTHPTSFRGSENRANPFETTLLIRDVAHTVVLGDVCEDGSLVIHTATDGTFLLYPDGGTSLIIDKTVPIAQLAVAHRHNLLLFRTGFSKDNHFCVFWLRNVFTDHKSIVTKHNINKYYLPHTKGCHLFCTSLLNDNFLRVAIAIKNKAYMWFWKHSALPMPQQEPPSPMDSPVKSFVKNKELPLADVPIMMTLLDERPTGKLIVAYRQGCIDTINEFNGETKRLVTLDAKNKLVTLSAFEENDQCLLLLGYDLNCKVLSIVDDIPQTKVDLVWESEPKYNVYKYPYMLGFTDNAVEIRTASNGSLVRNIIASNLRLMSYKGDIYFTTTSPIVSQHSSIQELPRIMESSSSGNLSRKTSGSKIIPVEACCLHKITFETIRSTLSPHLNTYGSEESLDKISTQSDISTFSETPTPTSKTTDPEVSSQKSVKFVTGDTESYDSESECVTSPKSNSGLNGSREFLYPASPNARIRKSMVKNLLPQGSTSPELTKNCLQDFGNSTSSQRMSILTVKQHFEVLDELNDSEDSSDKSDDGNETLTTYNKLDSGFNSASSTPSAAILQS